MKLLLIIVSVITAGFSINVFASTTDTGPAGPANVYQQESPFGTPPVSNALYKNFIKNIKFTFGGYGRFRYADNPSAATVPAENSALAGEHDAVEGLVELHTTARYKNTAFHAGVFITGSNMTGIQDQPNNVSLAQHTNNLNTVGGENTTLDYAYLTTELPYKFNLEVGRVPESFGGYGFTDSDSRRDRVLISKVFHGYNIFAALDRRNAGVKDPYGLPVADINSASLAFIGAAHHLQSKNYNLTWAFFYGHYQGNTATESYALNNGNHAYIYDPATRHSGFALTGTSEFSDYIEGKLYDYDVMIAHNYFGGGNGAIFNGGSNAYAVRIGHKLPEKLHLYLEWTQVLNGGFVHPGFDTMSSVINNNPDMNQSATRLIHLGGLGGVKGTPNSERFNQWFIMSKLTYRPTNAWLLSAGIGRMRRNGGYQTGYSMDPGAVFQGVANDIVYDVQADYQLNKMVNFTATWGRVNGMNHPKSYTGPLDAYAISAGVGVKF